MGSVLKDVYYNPDSPACFAGITGVYKEARKRDKKITLKEVREFLHDQNAYTLHKPVKRKFKRNITKTAGIDVDWQADLADMQSVSRYNGGNTYILVCIDVLSRYAFVEPIKNKKPETVGEAFRRIIVRSGRKCWFLTTDRGKEFVGKKFQDVLRMLNIHHHCATSPDVKSAIVERYIRTLKSRLWRYFTTHKTLNYTKALQKIVTGTNNAFHRTIGRKPASVTKKNETKVWQHLYGREDKLGKTLYKAGDHVRITKEKHKLSKGYQPNFTTEVFVVTRVLENRVPATYRVSDLNGEEIEGIFYNAELVKVARRSKLAESVDYIKQSKLKGKVLWHLAIMKNGPDKWIKDTQLTKT